MKYITLSLVAGVFAFSPTHAQIKPLYTKSEVLRIYDSLYISSELDAIKWTGNTQTCSPGSIPKEVYKKAENRINFFRIMCGLLPVKIDPESNAEAQSAALLVKANNECNHYPTKEMKCYSQSAYNGCSKSCLGITDWQWYKSTAFITGFILDIGESNYAVGHRRWLLSTRLKSFGYGATNGSEAILTSDGYVFQPIKDPEFTAYPWPGFVPDNLIFPKWSFSIPQTNTVDFSKTEVVMKDDNGKTFLIKKLKEFPNFLDHTIVWNVTEIFGEDDKNYHKNKLANKGLLDKRLLVEIKNVIVNGEKRSYSYYVIPFRPNANN